MPKETCKERLIGLACQLPWVIQAERWEAASEMIESIQEQLEPFMGPINKAKQGPHTAYEAGGIYDR